MQVSNIQILIPISILFIVIIFIYTKISKNKQQIQVVNQDLSKPSISQPKQIKKQQKIKKQRVKTQQNKKQQKNQLKTLKQIQEQYKQFYYGNVNLRNNKDMFSITALTVKNSKILMGNSKNQLVMFDLKKLKKQGSGPDRYFTSLDNNVATAIAISPHYYFAALSFDKTIVYFQFLGGEKGIYFKQKFRFNRNIYKGTQVAMFVPESEQFIVTAGAQADTNINIWNLHGDLLNTFSTYQIQHYQTTFGGLQAFVRGWTSQIKAFKFIVNKDGSFNKVEKGKHFTHSQKPRVATVDYLGNLIVTVSGTGDNVKLWTISQKSKSDQITIDTFKLGISHVDHAIIITTRGQNQRLKTVIVLSDSKNLIVTNKKFEQIKIFQNISVEGLVSFGSVKTAALGVRSGGKMMIWDVTSLVQSQQEYLFDDI